MGFGLISWITLRKSRTGRDRQSAKSKVTRSTRTVRNKFTDWRAVRVRRRALYLEAVGNDFLGNSQAKSVDGRFSEKETFWSDGREKVRKETRVEGVKG